MELAADLVEGPLDGVLELLIWGVSELLIWGYKVVQDRVFLFFELSDD
jgi:hypothetical protein